MTFGRYLWMAPLAVLALDLSLQGCGPSLPSNADLLDRFPTPIYSLTGEVLNGGTLGQPHCDYAQAAWLARIDSDHDGTIDLDELLAAARRQFAAMDLNHDGFVTAFELETYRSAFLSPPSDSDKNASDHADHPATRDERKMAVHPHGSQPDPVLAADVNLDFKVTLDEFLALQKDNFRDFDKDHDQTLEAQELNRLCRQREKAATPSSR